MVRDSGKRKLYWKKTRSDCYPGSWIHHKNLGTRCGNFFFPVIGNSENRKMRNRQMRINQVSVSGVWSHPILSTSSFLPPFLLCFGGGIGKAISKYQSKWPMFTLIFRVCGNWSFLTWKLKIRDSGKWWKKCGMRDFREKEQKCGIRTSCIRSLYRE